MPASACTLSNAPNSALADIDDARLAGCGREKSFDRNSARVGDISISALYIRCSSMFCRLMSTMKAMRGFKATR